MAQGSVAYGSAVRTACCPAAVYSMLGSAPFAPRRSSLIRTSRPSVLGQALVRSSKSETRRASRSSV